jgi:mannose-6-phosphate isomerase-like protein (cupin superfamily)
MSYLGETGEATAVYRQMDAVAPLKLGSTSARFVAPGSLTSGRFGLFRWDMAEPAGGAGPHFHRTFSESFYVLAGTVQVYDGTRWVDSSAGDFLYVPEGGVHGFRNDQAASMLILFAPGPPRERYFEELAEIIESGRQLSDEEWTELWARHDQYMV